MEKRKRKHSCGCRRTKDGNPKLIVSLCHGGGGYHPSVIERIRGKRLSRSWLVRLRGSEADDIDL